MLFNLNAFKALEFGFESEFALNFNARIIAARKLRNREIMCQMAYIFTLLTRKCD